MKKRIKAIFALVLASGLVVGWNLQNQQIAEALLGTNTFVTRNTTGGITNGSSNTPSISNDGRYVVFESKATNLIASDTNGYSDIFIKDTLSNTVSLVSVDSSGGQSNGRSFMPVISGDGKYVVFQSSATNLIASDTNGQDDIFRRNIVTNSTEIASVDSSGNQGNGESRAPDIDSEGRFIVFDTMASNLTSATDSNSAYDVILKDMNTGTTKLISQSDSGNISNAASAGPKISCDGRFIVFYSAASNLTSDTNNGWFDVFLTDMLVSQTVKNVTKSGDHSSYYPDISCDGKYIAFSSRAGNLGVNPTIGYASHDVYRYNRLTAAVDAVSTREDGSTPTSESYVSPDMTSFISSDGRYIIFTAAASNFVTSTTDSNGGLDLFLRDMNSTGFRIISKTSSGSTANYQSIGRDSSGVAFSGTNRIVFSSTGTDLVSGISDNTNTDIFMVDAGTPNTCSF